MKNKIKNNNSKNHLSIYYVPGTVKYYLHDLTSEIFIGRTDAEAETLTL